MQQPASPPLHQLDPEPRQNNRRSSVYFRDQLVGLAGDNRAGPQPLLSLRVLPTLPEENER